jgi:hypothetical protein
MAFPYVPVFLGLLVTYMVYSEWARLDSRYLIASALLLLVVTALVDAAGSTSLANTLAEFVFFLLAAGVVLLLVDHVRDGEPEPEEEPRWGSGVRSWEPHATDPTQEPQRAADQVLERPE